MDGSDETSERKKRSYEKKMKYQYRAGFSLRHSQAKKVTKGMTEMKRRDETNENKKGR